MNKSSMMTHLYLDTPACEVVKRPVQMIAMHNDIMVECYSDALFPSYAALHWSCVFVVTPQHVLHSDCL